MYKAFTCMSLICLLLCVPAAEGKNYAVLISAGVATTDDAAVNSCFWYNPYLQYTALLEEGYADDDIYFLYGWGTDFNSSHACYQPPYSVTDYPVNRANIQSVFNTLADIMTSNDFLYVWWMGHGSPSGGNLVMHIGTTGETVYDYEIAAWVGQITDYDVRSFSWMTCYSGGILDDVEGPRSIAMSSATFYESTYDQWLCDSYHAEFHYPERCAWAWETPCGICGPVDADSDDNGRVSFDEAFIYAEANTALSHPQISDLGGLAPSTYLGTPGEPTCDDGIQNQGEDRIDCGGPCPPCDCLSDAECDDNLFCTGVETCDAYGHCQPGSDPCPGQMCDEDNDICVDCFVDADCDDSLFCNGAETCVAGTCQPGTDPCPGQICDEVNDECISCLPKKAPCSIDAECCSGKCKGKPGSKNCQ